MASGHVNRTNRGRTHGRTDQHCTREESPCQLGAVHTWPIGTNFSLGPDVSFRGEAEVGGRQSSLPRSRMTQTGRATICLSVTLNI